MIKNDAAEGVINAIINVIARFSIPHRFADDPRDGGRCGRDEKPAWFGKNFDLPRKEPIDLGVDLFCQATERLYVFVVRSGKTAADIENFYFVASSF